jgi:uroporphyrinogen-III synthase
MPASDDRRAFHADRPLAGVRVAVTRDATRTDDLAAPLEALGAEVLVVPLVRVEPLDPSALRAALADPARYDWAAFTSRHAVRLALGALGDPRRIAGLRIAAVGAATGEALRAAGLAVSVVPERHSAEGLLEALAAAGGVRGARVLYVAAAEARDVLPRGLERLGAEVTQVPAYRTVFDAEGAEALRTLLAEGAVDVATLAAPSAVRALVAAMGEGPRGLPVITIGPVTTAAAREAGLMVAQEARVATARALAEAVAAWAASRASE